MFKVVYLLHSELKSFLAESAGFEPADHISTIGDLADHWFKPLTQLSIILFSLIHFYTVLKIVLHYHCRLQAIYVRNNEYMPLKN